MYQVSVAPPIPNAQVAVLTLLMVAVVILAGDQISKRLAIRSVRKRAAFPDWSGPRIRLIRNPNLGLGIVRRPSVLMVIWGASLVSIVFLVYRFSFLQGPVAVVALGAAIGGATGNLVDIMRRGAVVDFIDLRVWPVFNLADAAIVAGLLAAAVSIAFVA